MRIDLRTLKVLVSLAALGPLAGGCGGGGGTGPTPVSTPTPITSTGPAPIACATPPPNARPSPDPSVPYIDTTPTGLCLRSGGSRGVIQVTNRSDGPTLVVTRAEVRNDAQGAFTITRNDCDQLGGKSLTPAQVCQIDIHPNCPAAPGTAILRIESNADNRPRYDVPMTCNP